MKLQESGEMYLETILVLSKEHEFVRAIDISNYRGFSKPSVSRALGILRNGGFIKTDPSGHITLTKDGRAIAEKIYERHTVLTKVLMSIGVDEETAASDACRIEHVISDTAFDALKKHMAEHHSI